MAAEPIVEVVDCLHCGLPIPPGIDLYATVRGVEAPMCCIGCRAAAQMIESAGLGAWYSRREGPSGIAAALPEAVAGAMEFLDSAEFSGEFVDRASDELDEANLLVDSLRCAACVWVIERHLGSLEGVHQVGVNLSSHRVYVTWDRQLLGLRDLIARLAEIGFSAQPDRPGARAERARQENRQALIRLGVSGLGAMNVMSYSAALYFGAALDMSHGSEALMRWMGWLVSTPVVVIAARPFFEGAWRDLSHRTAGMDVPVALAIGGAYCVSAFATFKGTGEVYFDSVCMFTFFLTLGRYLEQRVQSKSSSFIRDMLDRAPVIARRLDSIASEIESIIPARALGVGDLVRVRQGEVIPADGRIAAGTSSVDESLLSGEPWPRSVGVGDSVVAGSQNVEETLVVEAIRVGRETALAGTLALVERAGAERAPIAQLADRVASYFVSGVLGLAILNAIGWNFVDPDKAIWTTLCVLVATCPCALSLATPIAISSAAEGLARSGFLMSNARVLETLTRINHVIFDKTGTLTTGEPVVSEIVVLEGATRREVIGWARSLERESVHPVARAFMGRLDESGLEGVGRSGTFEVQNLEHVVGAGVEGETGGRTLRIGKPEWSSFGATSIDEAPSTAGEALIWILLADREGPLAWFGLADPARDSALAAVRSFKERGLSVELLSGDPSPAAAEIADRYDLMVCRTGAGPEEKLERVLECQAAGDCVALVGDGMNDSPALRAADVSISMGTGSDLTRMNSDAVILRDDLSLLPVAHDWARRTTHVIRQNLTWAAGYNLLALPLAISGQLSPWMAALGMSTSSLLVVLNAMRLRRRRSA